MLKSLQSMELCLTQEPDLNRWTAKHRAEFITRYGTLGGARDPISLRCDNGLVFTSRHDSGAVNHYGLKQAFIRPHTPHHNGMVERLIRTVKEQGLWLHHFQSLDEARQMLRAWFKYYNEQRPHQALRMKIPSKVYQQLAA